METIGSVVEIELYTSMFLKQERIPVINSEGLFVFIRKLHDSITRDALCIKSSWHNIDKKYMFFSCSDYMSIISIGEYRL